MYSKKIKSNKTKDFKINKDTDESEGNNIISSHKCYLPLDKSTNRIIHLIITRFLVEFFNKFDFEKKIYKDEYIINANRVMKKYLFPSLENQICKDFIWVLLIGNKANITKVTNFLNLNLPFQFTIIYLKDIKNYIKDISKGYEVLITTRIDYDDQIYYDAVNDVRKSINIHKPIQLYGYNRGVYYFESNNKYYEMDRTFNKDGIMSIFASLIIILNKVKNIFTIYDLGDHSSIRKNLLKNLNIFGIKELKYDPGNFDSGSPKFIWVRQKLSGSYQYTINIPNISKETYFNISEFIGK